MSRLALSARSRKRMLALILTTASLAGVASLATAAPAGADQFGLGNSTSGVIPDNFNHTYCFSGNNWNATWRGLVNGRMANLDTQTSYYDTSKACDNITDVQFQLTTSAVIGAGTRGDYRCMARNSANNCERAIVRINTSAGVLVDDHQRRKTICHEIGHSVGLAHGTNVNTFWNDCMLSGTAPAGAQYERFNAHHISHANSRTAANA